MQVLLLLELSSLGSLSLDILDSCLDGILCKHTAMQFDWRETQVLGNVTVLDGKNLIY